ncbi:MAG TPA: hypothetical protein VJ654_10475 [Noviherbaspirillum sp.]|nr:hypothetical protein [Noviherbaspirillum sp.]
MIFYLSGMFRLMDSRLCGNVLCLVHIRHDALFSGLDRLQQGGGETSVIQGIEILFVAPMLRKQAGDCPGNTTLIQLHGGQNDVSIDVPSRYIF